MFIARSVLADVDDVGAQYNGTLLASSLRFPPSIREERLRSGRSEFQTPAMRVVCDLARCEDAPGAIHERLRSRSLPPRWVATTYVGEPHESIRIRPELLEVRV